MVNFKLPRGPNTLTAGVSRRALDDEKPTASDRFVSFGDRVRYDDATGARADDARRGARLRVIASDDDADDATSTSSAARVHEGLRETATRDDALRRFARRGAALGGSTVRFEPSRDVPVGCVAMTRAMRHNMRLALDKDAEFEAVEASEVDDAVDVAMELSRVRDDDDDDDDDEREIESEVARRAMRAHFGELGRVLTTSEVFVLDIDGSTYRARVADVNSKTCEEVAATLGYHCFRARVNAETTFYVRSSDENSLRIANNEGKARSVRLARREVIEVRTKDGETFPVNRRLLRQCIALTSAVRRAGELGEDDADEFVSADVDIDTDVFDRALIFLERAATGQPPPAFDIRVTEALARAAEVLECRSLEEYCAEKLGAYGSRIREYDWDEVVAHNAAGGVWLVIDGMVLDVKRWLNEHPGGDTIIPKQSLDMDAARHFEMYHSSRESFLYLKEFYIGEVRARDRARVPSPSPEASEDFLRQLRQYTTFRIEGDVAPTRVHLGQ